MLLVLGGALFSPGRAEAQWTVTQVTTPWPNSPVRVSVGKANNKIQVCFEEKVSPFRTALFNTNMTALTSTLLVTAGNMNDEFQTGGNGWHVSGCGLIFGSFATNGYALMADLGAGNDSAWVSNSYITLFGGSGNDRLIQGLFVYGMDGDDAIAAGATSDNSMYGGEGNDCMNDINNQAADYSCNGGVDKHETNDGIIIAVLGNTQCEAGASNAVVGCIPGADH